MTEHLKWEREWWGTCQNTFGEEYKQIAYAKRMGLQFFHDGKSPFNIDMQGKTVIDIGGGPSSLLLKCQNLGRAMVVDPCEYPAWVYERYMMAGVFVMRIPAEALNEEIVWDEGWIYNVLQHTVNPSVIIENVKRCTRLIRVFEWVDTYVSEGHPHVLTEEGLNEWLGGEGKVEFINENTAVGKCYYGIFKGNHYDSIGQPISREESITTAERCEDAQTELGRLLMSIREKAIKSGMKLLTEEEIPETTCVWHRPQYLQEEYEERYRRGENPFAI